jgi:surface polysaccharide O-acyltransferase-like enzyme
MKMEKKISVGLAVLRIYLSFLVVSTHCFRPTSKIIIIRIINNKVHVPNFFILSFYFCNKLFKSKDINKIKIRFQRLLIPYFFWPILIWSLNNLLSFLFIKINKISYNNLILQILTGSVFMGVLWFQYNLIFITLLIVILHLLFNEQLVFFILINLTFAGIFFTYSNYNFILFSQYDFYIYFTFGRFFEIIPYCTIGYFLACLNLVHILSKNKILYINIFLSILILNLKYKIFLGIRGFCFQGLKLYFSSISIFLLFSLIPNERTGNEYIIKYIKFISNSTAGVYFIHMSVYRYLKIFSLIKNGTLSETIIIYILSYFISFCGKIIFRKTKLINLFQ